MLQGRADWITAWETLDLASLLTERAKRDRAADHHLLMNHESSQSALSLAFRHQAILFSLQRTGWCVGILLIPQLLHEVHDTKSKYALELTLTHSKFC